MHQTSGQTRLVLFDIDGTLLSCGYQTRPIFAAALTEVFGTAGDMEGYSFAGRTDHEIVTDLMVGAGLEPEAVERRIPEVRECYLARLATGLRRDGMRLLPGVVEVLDGLAAREDVLLGLLTGNWEAGARIKLSRFDLNGYFEFGAFGDDQPDRMGLPEVAIRRAGEISGEAFGATRTLLVADSLLDVECALGHGIELLAVTTGHASAAELAAAGATSVVTDLTEILGGDHLLDRIPVRGAPDPRL